MSTATAVASHAASYELTTSAHQQTSVIKIELRSDPKSDQLPLRFVPFAHQGEPTDIGVFALLAECVHYTSPNGFKIVDNKHLEVYYSHTNGGEKYLDEQQRDILAEALRRLTERLGSIADERNTTHRRDPETRIVGKR